MSSHSAGGKTKAPKGYARLDQPHTASGGRNQGSNPSTPSPQSSALTLRASCLNSHSADFCSWETPLGRRVAGPPEGPINHSALAAEPGTLFTWRSLLPPKILAAFSRGEILGLRPPSSRKEKHLGSSTFLMLMLGRSAVHRGGRAVTASIFSAICQEYFKWAILVRAVLCTCNCSTTGSWETKGAKWIFWGVFVCLFVYVKCCELALQPPFK